jgi:hypothetical protein
MFWLTARLEMGLLAVLFGAAPAWKKQKATGKK